MKRKEINDIADQLTPLQAALGAGVVIPLAAGVLVAGAATLLLTWPVVPVLVYLQKREKLPTASAQEVEAEVVGNPNESPA